MPRWYLSGFFRAFLVLALLITTGVAWTAEAEEAEEDKSWVEGTMGRFFGNNSLPGDEIKGEGLEVVSPYVAFAGKTIEVVIVRQVKNFDQGWDEDRLQAEQLLNTLSSPLRSYTRESILRQYLLFEAGDQVIPFDLADSERMLRELSYITDVKLTIVPLEGDADRVAVVVETADRWPFGVTATVITQDNWRAKLYTSNLLGTGTYFSNSVLYRKGGSKDWGYRGETRKANLGGSFWGAGIDYEDSFRKDEFKVWLDRSMSHPGLNYLGGAMYLKLDDYERDGVPTGYEQTDIWGGPVIRFYDHRTAKSGSRTFMVPAVRVNTRHYFNRPAASPDTNRGRHHYKQLMASVALTTGKTYKTSYLFAEGEVEDINSGLTVKLTGMLEDREFEYRPAMFFDSGWISFRNKGDLFYLALSAGGFHEENSIEDGILSLKGGYFSPLLGSGQYRHRLMATLKLTRGIGRHPFDKIYLDDKAGIYEMPNGQVYGNKRIVLKSLYRLFTPLSLWGFRMSFLAFADAGVIAGEDTTFHGQRVHVSTGLGVRVRNPNLILPTFQLRVFVVSNAQESGMRFGINLGNAPYPSFQFPGLKPGTLAYE